MRAGAAFLCFLISFAAAVAAPPALVYRVDSATARISNHRLVIVARGAVRSGGWEKPRLVVREPSASETHGMSVDFVATPPADKAVVIQGLLPVRVRYVMRLPRQGVTDVKVISETNAVTARIVFREKLQKTASR